MSPRLVGVRLQRLAGLVPVVEEIMEGAVQDDVDDARVSTILYESGRAETYVFDGPHDGYGRRYQSHEQAIHGHAEVVASLVARMAPEEKP